MIKMICYIPSLFSKAVNYFHFIPSHVRRSVIATNKASSKTLQYLPPLPLLLHCYYPIEGTNS